MDGEAEDPVGYLIIGYRAIQWFNELVGEDEREEWE